MNTDELNNTVKVSNNGFRIEHTDSLNTFIDTFTMGFFLFFVAFNSLAAHGSQYQISISVLFTSLKMKPNIE